jgi:hypothetical protein
VIGRELGSRGQDLLRFADVVGSCLRNMAYVYGVVLVVLAVSCARDECGGVTCACTCPKRRNINVVIQDTCTLSSLVNKCITICTLSIYLVVRLANPITYLMRDARTVKDSKSRHNLLVCRQEVCVVAVTIIIFIDYLVASHLTP